MDRESFEKILKDIKTEILFNVGEVYYLSNGNVLQSEEFKKGNIVIQDGSSHLVVKNLAVEEKNVVLDACAAPGGKSLGILQEYA